MDYYKKYQSEEWVKIQNEIEKDENSASIMDEFRDNNKKTGMTTEINHKLNWYKIFDIDGFLIIQGYNNN